MSELENPEENGCFGCGPRHPRGLRLRFERGEGADGTPEVRTHFTPKEDETGWPTLFHHGLHFTVLYETSYWAALTLAEKLWVSTGPIRYVADRLPRVGTEHVARARLVTAEPELLTIRAETSTREGKPVGSLDSTWRRASRPVLERAGIRLPGYLDAELAP